MASPLTPIKSKKFSRRFSFTPRKLKDIEWILWTIPIILVFLSGLLIASTQRNIDYAQWYQHWFTGILGILVAFFLAQLPLERIRLFLMPLYFLTISALLAVRFFGVSALGAQRWLSFGGVNIQPSEIAKITLIVVLAALLERQKFDSPRQLWKPLLVISLPWFLVFIQPDLGTSLVFGAVLLIMLYWSGMPLEWLLISLSGIFTSILSGLFPLLLFAWIPFIGFLAYKSLGKKNLPAILIMSLQSLIAWLTPWLWNYGLKDYQRDRLLLFIEPTKDPLGGGYHLIQSTIGIGSGGILGTGLFQGQLTKLRFIPEQHTDFIFSALGEETGFLGTLFVIISFLIFILRLINISRDAHTDFESLVVIGVASMIIFQVVVNIFMTIGLGPITGIPLPFMSYGRTALLVNFISLGLCLSVARRGRSFNKNW
ncbi:MULTISPECIES: rod shape-determining protein RodA [Prochlorococcus]|uniref:rod shape-determining protein RodA n=1 Tax=Prochlorococcus TaxID=1218 RepID=UPI0005337BBF|nr:MULTISPECIES: rod shape-determining protein RodA [Prochlorococcus]KGG13603.1 Rod shape-determining protein RodA [Prochlorococcus sp. MIT 0601]